MRIINLWLILKQKISDLVMCKQFLIVKITKFIHFKVTIQFK